MDKKDEELLRELKAFRKQLSNHDSLVMTREALYEFFHKEGVEITIKLKADLCASKVEVGINGFTSSRKDVGSFDLHEIVRHAIREYSKKTS